jgi:hypothetical protein
VVHSVKTGYSSLADVLLVCCSEICLRLPLISSSQRKIAFAFVFAFRSRTKTPILSMWNGLLIFRCPIAYMVDRQTDIAGVLRSPVASFTLGTMQGRQDRQIWYSRINACRCFCARRKSPYHHLIPSLDFRNKGKRLDRMCVYPSVVIGRVMVSI